MFVASTDKWAVTGPCSEVSLPLASKTTVLASVRAACEHFCRAHTNAVHTHTPSPVAHAAALGAQRTPDSIADVPSVTQRKVTFVTGDHQTRRHGEHTLACTLPSAADLEAYLCLF